MGTAGIAWLLRQMAVECYRVLKPGGSLCVFCDWRMIVNLAPAMESSGLRWQNLIAWDKGAPGLGVGFRPKSEHILHFVKAVGRFYAKNVGNVLNYSRVPTGQREHQTEKPVELFEDLVRVTTPKGGVVLDPFAGSFASGEAALARGRQYIGVDWARAYVTSGRMRLDAVARQPRLLDDEPEYVEQEELPFAIGIEPVAPDGAAFSIETTWEEQ
jgi:site-specific DNA-methyltransferase (adenine-specific)